MKTIHWMQAAMFAAIMGVLGFLPPIPLSFTPVPISFQTIGVMIAGGVLGARLGALSQIIFLLTVAAGAPLLAGGRGGLAVFAGPSAGFLISWIAGAFVIGLLTERAAKLTARRTFAANLVGGVAVLYAIGIPVQSFVTGVGLKEVTIASMAFIPGDVLKSAAAAVLVPKLRTALQAVPSFRRAA
ncbi:biotin transporter BioY [Domibacillus sp. A3M-37]|jgi:biotin transport system substrate-specific component|uniref:biotin transporter BioY n=1 Tax=Domibacillus TaxID=1433999 RepID=UPI0006182F47|nr:MULTISPECIES: biotin transporter BioY [Domibacillus]MCP3762817.1 biotin transporter BioY [Domibacillus sp. A3M-37]